MIQLTPSEMVRIELLRHEDPDGIHPIEKAWRELARKLLDELEKVELQLAHKIKDLPEYKRTEWEKSFTPTDFPKAFTTKKDSIV